MKTINRKRKEWQPQLKKKDESIVDHNFLGVLGT